MLDDLRVLVTVAEAGGFRAAAQALGVPRSTISRRIQALEQAVGTTLLFRTTREVQLTDAGRALVERAARLVKEACVALEEVKDAGRRPQGTLRLTAPQTFERALPPLLARYLEEHPLVHVEVELTQRLVDLVEEGFDVAIRGGPSSDERLVSRRIAVADGRYVASPAYLAQRGAPSSPEDLARHECVLLRSEGPEPRWPFQAPGQPARQVRVKGRLRVDSIGLALEAARAGIGIARAPSFACAADLASGRLVLVLADVSPDQRPVFLVYPESRRLDPKVRSFVDVVVASFAERAPW